MAFRQGNCKSKDREGGEHDVLLVRGKGWEQGHGVRQAGCDVIVQ